MNSKKLPKGITIIEQDPFFLLVEKAKKDAELKAVSLALELKKNVYPIVTVRPSTKEIFVGFIAEPTRGAKMQAFDIMSSKESITEAGEVILTSSLIKEHSDEAFYSLDSQYDDVFMGACIDSLGHINVLMNTLKKK